MNQIDNQLIVSFDPESKAYVMNELHGPGKMTMFQDLASGMMLIEYEMTFQDVAAYFHLQRPVFIRHICPVYCSVAIADGLDMHLLKAQIHQIKHKLDKAVPFSIQTRKKCKNKERHPAVFDINNDIANMLEKDGYILDVKQPAQVVSIALTDEYIYIGISKTEQNLSNWGGGMRRFAREETQISRAEFKLLEAFEVFGAENPLMRNMLSEAVTSRTSTKAPLLALDLGAAPGGWSRMLLHLGFHVVAVDPAKLDKRLDAVRGSIAGDEKLFTNNFAEKQAAIYYQMKAAEFFEQIANAHVSDDNGMFDIVVNDMRMDYMESVHTMLQARQYIKNGGIGMMTLKLFPGEMQRSVNKAIKMLAEEYVIIGARQLFHNRNEVTVVLHNT